MTSIVDVDQELTEGIPEDDVPFARHVLTRPRHDVPRKTCAPRLLDVKGGFALLVTDGVLLREVGLAGRQCAQIFGAGDVLQEAGRDPALDCEVTWSVLEPCSIVILDERFSLAARRWPSLALNLQRRLLDQADRTALHAATAQLGRVDQRVLALFWQLADRWGRVTPFGVEVGLGLTHETIGRLVGARRPTITLALATMVEAGMLRRTPAGRWLLKPGTDAALRMPVARQAGAVAT